MIACSDASCQCVSVRLFRKAICVNLWLAPYGSTALKIFAAFEPDPNSNTKDEEP